MHPACNPYVSQAALASSLSQKDAQLGHRLEEYEGQVLPCAW